ncbi:phage tail domain-containing protein [Atopococcus tabaci]|uniref:phage tail domain-containing protein n=1 Tax=Atopococcus tabaci TaxID=269774 RepID=UPI002409919B|nr:phage tail domain-containing protein [Atopococcus tabaci]
MRAYFEYKGVLSTDFYLYIQNDISFPSPEADIEFVEIPGRDGELAISNNRLKGVSFPIPVILNLPANQTIEDVSTRISNWLKNDIGWYPLRFSGSDDYEYIALFYEQFDIKENLETYGRTVLNFRLKPYKRLLKDREIAMENGQTVLNTGYRQSKPLIEIEAVGDVTLQNNGKDWLILRGVDGSITVDSEMMTVYKGDRLQADKMIGTLSPMFPLLDIGENAITWTGNVTRVTITPRWEAVM